MITTTAVSPYAMYGRPTVTTWPDDAARSGGYFGAAMSVPVWKAPPTHAPARRDRPGQRPHRQLGSVECAETALRRELRCQLGVLRFGLLELSVEVRGLAVRGGQRADGCR